MKNYRDLTTAEAKALYLELSEKYENLKLSDMIYFAESTTRVYPFGSLASHVIGFCVNDGGLYGL